MLKIQHPIVALQWRAIGTDRVLEQFHCNTFRPLYWIMDTEDQTRMQGVYIEFLLDLRFTQAITVIPCLNMQHTGNGGLNEPAKNAFLGVYVHKVSIVLFIITK